MDFKFKNQAFKKSGLFLAFAIVFFGGVLLGNLYQTKDSSLPLNESFLILDPSQKIEVKIWYVIDGDTLKLESGESIRLIGVDANKLYKGETKIPDEFGNKAAELSKSWVENKIVLLELDKTELRDQYGRVLAYVWVDDKMLNMELIKRGFAKISQEFLNGKFKYKEMFLEAENYAKEHKLGLWKEVK